MTTRRSDELKLAALRARVMEGIDALERGEFDEIEGPAIGYTVIVPPTFKAVVAQALELPDEERGELAALLLRSLEPDDGEDLSHAEWEDAWSAELDERLRQIREGTADLVDGDEVLAELRDIVDRP